MSLTRRQVTSAAIAAVPLVGRSRRESRTLHIAGDSTAAQKYADAAPETGWGTALPFFLRKEVEVANHAVNGRSSKSFVDEGRLDAILAGIRPGDLLLIQFAHNDEKSTDPARYTEPWTTYQEYLRRHIDGARDRKARPAKTYFNWTATEQDNTHFDPPGAIAVARLVARELLRTRVAARHDVVRLHEDIPTSWITWPPA